MLDNFAGGIDRRRDRNAMDEGRLWNIRNATIDKGRQLGVRWGCRRKYEFGSLELCEGWFDHWQNGISTFAVVGTAFNANSQASVIQLDASSTGNTVLKKIWSVHAFANSYYVVAEYGDGSVAHHYTDVTAPGTRVTDSNCPNTKSVTVVGNRVFAIGASGAGTVRFSELGNPRDWTDATAATGAGFLAVTANQSGVGQPTAVGQYQQDLAVFFRNASQLWFPDVTKENMFLRQRIYNAGTTAIQSIFPFAEDLAFVSPAGIRSLAIAQQTTNRYATDIGAQIDNLPIGNAEVSAAVHHLVYPRTGGANVNIEAPITAYSEELGQLWVAFGRVNESQTLLPAAADLAGSNSTAICVLTYSKLEKVSGWTLMHAPYVIRDLKEYTDATTGLTVMLGLASVNAAAPYNPVFVQFSPEWFHDALIDNTAADIEGEIVMPFLDNKKPGIQKQFSTVDLKAVGAFDLSAAFNPNRPSVETVSIPIEIDAETAPDGLIPFELSATSVSPVLRFTQEVGAERASQLSGLQMYYEELGPV